MATNLDYPRLTQRLKVPETLRLELGQQAGKEGDAAGSLRLTQGVGLPESRYRSKALLSITDAFL